MKTVDRAAAPARSSHQSASHHPIGDLLAAGGQFNALFELCPDALIALDGLTVVAANPSAVQLYKADSPEQLVGLDAHTLVHPEDRDLAIQRLQSALRTRFMPMRPIRMCALDGSVITVESSGTLIHAGARPLVLAVQRDITARLAAQADLAAQHERLEMVIEATEAGIWSWDRQSGQPIHVSARMREILGWGPDVVPPTEFKASDWVHPDDQARVAEARQRHLRDRERYHIEHRIRHATKGWIWVAATLSTRWKEDGTPRLHVVSVRDITQEREIEERLKASEQRFRDVVEAAGEYVWETDAQGCYTYLSDRVEQVLGYRAEHLLGRSPRSLMPAEDVEMVKRWNEEYLRHNQPFHGLEHRSIHANGSIVWQRVSGLPMLEKDGSLRGYRGMSLDITASREAHARAEFLATRDPLTGLPNRVLLNDRIDQAIAAAKRNNTKLAILFIDLDRFKHINDSMGHAAGDEYLACLASRMRAALRDSDTLSRLGGDEFVVLAENLHSLTHASSVAEHLLASARAPIVIDGTEVPASMSIGVSLFPNDAPDRATLLRNADSAMYHAKEAGRGTYKFYSAELNQRAIDRLRTEAELRNALDHGQLQLLYQPIVKSATGELVSCEALLRWSHPERGVLLPAAFIDVAEDTGLIRPIGEWVIDSVVAQIRAWRDAGYEPVRVTLNVSVAQLAQGGLFVRRIANALQRHAVEPHDLELEVTESLLMRDVESNVDVLERLTALGITISVDDFGTGYSSLAYLKRLPIHALKIDRAFVRDLHDDPSDAAIVGAIIAMANKLELTTIAEGVETPGQLQRLRELGANHCQGFFFSKPVTADKLAADFLRRRR